MSPRRFQIVSDIHGCEKDERACSASLAFCRAFNPEIRIIAGDLFDFSTIRKGADETERHGSMLEDFKAGREYAEAFFAGGDERHLMLGNHDVRPLDMAESPDAVRSDLGTKMHQDIVDLAARCNAKLWPYDTRDGVLKIGHLQVVHGYHTGASACASHSRVYGNVVFGHIHSIESFQTPGLKQQEARSIGCLCSLNMSYANRKTGKLKWAHGWAYGWLFEDGTYQLQQTRDVDGKFYASTEITAF